MTDTVVFNISHEVEIGSEEAAKIYAAYADALLNGGFSGGIHPLKVRADNGVANVEYVDVDDDVYGSRPLADAVSAMMIFDDVFNGDDWDMAVAEAETVATAFEEQARRVRERIASKTEGRG